MPAMRPNPTHAQVLLSRATGGHAHPRLKIAQTRQPARDCNAAHQLPAEHAAAKLRVTYNFDTNDQIIGLD
jgi:hypothetical protein